MTVIVDCGGANLNSIIFALRRIGSNAIISRDAEIIRKASHVILPGVGTASDAMQRLEEYNLIDVITHLRQPVLGICLGMQLLYDFSEEGDVACLKIIPGKIVKLPESKSITIPHMGWNTIALETNSPLLKNIHDQSYAYFVHSYCAPLNQYSVGVTCHGSVFAAIVQKNNFYGAQFHPERSSRMGSQLLKNFLELSYANLSSN